MIECPPASLKAKSVFDELSFPRKLKVLSLCQVLPELVEVGKVKVIDSVKSPPIYQFHWASENILIDFKILPQSQIAVILTLKA